jgi:hypothetical protein
MTPGRPLVRASLLRPAPGSRAIAIPRLTRVERQAQLQLLGDSAVNGSAPSQFVTMVTVAALADDRLSSAEQACAWHDYVTARRRFEAILDAESGWDGLMTCAEASASAAACMARLLDGVPPRTRRRRPADRSQQGDPRYC